MASAILKLGSALATELGTPFLSLSKEKISLIRAVRGDMEAIKGDMELMQAFIRNADRMITGDVGLTATWVEQVRELAYQIEDMVDEFTYFLGEPKSYGFSKFITRAFQASRNIKAKHGIHCPLYLLHAILFI